jgi:hypothetical protein
VRLVELVRVANINGCALCGLTPSRHPVQGFGHMDDTENELITTKEFIRPLASLLARRRAYRTLDGRELAGIDEDTGEPNTDLVRTTCRCGAATIVTPSRADIARCGACIYAAAHP